MKQRRDFAYTLALLWWLCRGVNSPPDGQPERESLRAPGAWGQRRRCELTYVLDLAEIPTFELMQDVESDARCGQSRCPATRKLPFRPGQWAAESERSPKTVKTLTPRIESTELGDHRRGRQSARVPHHHQTACLPLQKAAALSTRIIIIPTRAGWREIVIHPGAREPM